MNLTPEESTFSVRRSIHVNAAPERVWDEFSSFARMNPWWGIVTGEPQAGTSKGQWLEVYEPQRCGRIRMAVNWDGSRVAYGGEIKALRTGHGTDLRERLDSQPGMARAHTHDDSAEACPGRNDGRIVPLRLRADRRRCWRDAAGYEAGWGMTQLAELKRIVEAAA